MSAALKLLTIFTVLSFFSTELWAQSAQGAQGKQWEEEETQNPAFETQKMMAQALKFNSDYAIYQVIQPSSKGTLTTLRVCLKRDIRSCTMTIGGRPITEVGMFEIVKLLEQFSAANISIPPGYPVAGGLAGAVVGGNVHNFAHVGADIASVVKKVKLPNWGWPSLIGGFLLGAGGTSAYLYYQNGEAREVQAKAASVARDLKLRTPRIEDPELTLVINLIQTAIQKGHALEPYSQKGEITLPIPKYFTIWN